MLVDLKPRLEDPDIHMLISYAILPDPDRLHQVVDAYRSQPRHQIVGLEQDGRVVGMVGYRVDEKQTLTIQHLAVDPLERGLGYGRGLILELITHEQPKLLRAETDEEAVDFYRNIGFEIVSLGERYPGVERFMCTYTVNEEG